MGKEALKMKTPPTKPNSERTYNING